MRVRAMLAALLIGAAVVPAAAQPAGNCAVTAVEGREARVQRGAAWAPLGPGPLAAADRLVETGPATRLEVRCADGAVVTIGPDSRVDLGQLPAGPEQSVFMQLLEGIMGIVAPPRADGLLAVQTPVAIASVRSTEWLVEHLEGRTAVFVRAGQVAVANDGGEFLLGPGEGITLVRDGVVKPAGRWGPERVRQVNEALGFGWD